MLQHCFDVSVILKQLRSCSLQRRRRCGCCTTKFGRCRHRARLPRGGDPYLFSEQQNVRMLVAKGVEGGDLAQSWGVS